MTRPHDTLCLLFEHTRSAAKPQGVVNSIKYNAVLAFPIVFFRANRRGPMLPLSYIIQVLRRFPFSSSTPNFTWYSLVARPRLEESSTNPVPIHAW